MWTCPLCRRAFKKINQPHSCNERTTDDFLRGKSAQTIDLFNHFIKEYQLLGKISIHPKKSMITLSGKKGFAHITQLGKNFIDVVFPFQKRFEENLCFLKINAVPGSKDHNHYFRMCFKEDINEEVIYFMKLALEQAT